MPNIPAMPNSAKCCGIIFGRMFTGCLRCSNGFIGVKLLLWINLISMQKFNVNEVGILKGYKSFKGALVF